MAIPAEYPMDGSCNCGTITYTMLKQPLIISACHCTRCQRRTGAPFSVSAYIEADQVQITSRFQPQLTFAPTPRYGDMIHAQCPDCLVNLWYTFEAEGGFVKFVKVSTLERAREMQPRVHIWTNSKVDWVVIPEGHVRFLEGYDDSDEGREQDSLNREAAFKDQQMDFFSRWMAGKNKPRVTVKPVTRAPGAPIPNGALKGSRKANGSDSKQKAVIKVVKFKD